MSLKQLARKEVITAGPAESIADIATRMADHNVGSVVITRDSEPVGIVTDRDVTVRVVSEAHDPAETTAEDIMTPDPATVPIDTGLFQVTEAMKAAGVRRMPVVDDGELAGIITLDDLTGLLVDELDNIGDVIETELPPY